MKGVNDLIKERLKVRLSQKAKLPATLIKESRIKKFRVSFFVAFSLLVLLPLTTAGFFIYALKHEGLAGNIENTSSALSSLSSSSKISENQPAQKPSVLLNQEFSQSVLLDIPLIKQKYTLSCEAASLQMALSLYGIESDQDSLLDQFGIAQPKIMENVNGKLIWGDPDEGFVGDPKGDFTGVKDGVKSLKYGTGQGVSNGPVARVARKYRPNSLEIDNATLEQVKTALNNKNPIIFWHRRDDIFPETMEIFTKSGKRVIIQQNHVNLLIGYRTNQDKTLTYLFNDPYFGYLEMSENDMQRVWSRNNREIVVVK